MSSQPFQIIVRGNTPDELVKNVNHVASLLNKGKAPIVTEPAAPIVTEPEAPIVTEPAAPVDNYTGDIPEVDCDGLPWDVRIHSSSKEKTKKGAWKKRKGVDDNTQAQVRAELLNAGASTLAASVGTLEMTPPSHSEPAATTPAMPTPGSQMSSGHTVETFKQNFPLIISGLLTEQKISQEYVQQLCDHFGVTQIFMLNDQQKAELFNGFVENSIIHRV